MVECTYPNCHQKFDTIKLMKKHKKFAPEHDYCSTCDVDCRNDNELHIHKLMSSRHIACPICAMEFKSEGGREVHLKQNHPHQQRLVCPGCNVIFTRAHALMAHVEKNECQNIDAEHFDQQRAKRQVLKAHFENALGIDPYTLHRPFGYSVSGVSGGASEDGGVTLGTDFGDRSEDMDDVSIGQHMARYQDLSEENDRPALPGKITASEGWPVLPGSEIEKGMSFNSNETDWPSKYGKNEQHLIDLKASNNPETQTNSMRESLFPETSEQNFKQKYYSPRPSVHVSESANSLRSGPPPSHVGSAYTNLSSYDVNKFLDPFTARYVCPLQHCQQDFKTPKEFNSHLLSVNHVGGKISCPGCLRLFRTASALIAHMESSTTRCTVNQSQNYNQVIREISGGLLGTHQHHSDGTVKYVTPMDHL